MKIARELRDSYKTFDPETDFFLDCFDEEPGQTILEVGAHDAPVSSLMAQSGHKVVSVDLRPYDFDLVPDHKHVVGNFNAVTLPPAFSVAVSISALEHFGMGTYGDTLRAYSDVLAARKIWELLDPGGMFYCLVPFGGKYIEHFPHFRVYDFASFVDRILQDFSIEWIYTRIVDVCPMMPQLPPIGTPVNWIQILSNQNGSTAIAALVKMRKVGV